MQCAKLRHTRKLSYRKDDRAMFYRFLMGFFFRSMPALRMCVQNFKFVALPIPEIIEGTQKIGQSLDTPTIPFLANF